MMLNETVSMESAQALARRILEQGGAADSDRITYAFRRVLSRPPTDAERTTLMELLAKQKARVGDGWINPWLLGSNRKDAAPENLPAKTNPAELAAYTVAARVLLSLDETITKE